VTDTRASSLLIRVIAFGALAAYAGASWVALVSEPPRGRTALVVLVAIGAAAALAWVAGRSSKLASRGGALAVAIVALALASIAMGLPARLLAPPNWGELGSELGGALRGLSALAYPYHGDAEWSRLVILLGLPVSLGLAAALAFWPARRTAPFLRTAALVVLVATYGVGATVSPPGAPLLHGLVLLALLAAWLWLPGLGGRQAIAAAALVASAGLLALPVASRLDGSRAWLDYRSWDWAGSALAGGESFDWNHTYGPLDWTRTGQTLLEVSSGAPHYWRTAELDRFDGFRWLETTASGNAAAELPRSTTSSRSGSQTVRLNPRWIQNLSFTVRGLSSQLVVAAGTPLAVKGLTDVAPIQGGLALPPDNPLSEGDSYAIRAYIPDPTPEQMRRASRTYPRALSPYTVVVLPSSRTYPPGPSPANPSLSPSTRVTLRQLTVPFWGAPGARRAGQALSHSSYAGVYRLTRRVTAGAHTPYDAVQRLESYLRSSYAYSEIPPQRQLPLRAFLLRDGIGYCQQFSGAMALMLRMLGIPARVASGFTPGTPSDSGTYVVRDFDAHSWVEAYFNGIGWVPFDPTPAAAPAESQTTGLGAHGPGLRRTARPLPAGPGGNLTLRRSPAPGSGSSGSALWLVPVAIGLLALGGLGTMGLRALRNRRLTAVALIQAQLRELDAALRRVRSRPARGTTLLALERRLAVVAGPASAGYAAKLRAARYAPGPNSPPTPGDRRAVRRELTSGLGLRARLRGLLAMPPGGPAGLRRITL
jgi:protein-glutamine gamma-glutamyltransferase